MENLLDKHFKKNADALSCGSFVREDTSPAKDGWNQTAPWMQEKLDRLGLPAGSKGLRVSKDSEHVPDEEEKKTRLRIMGIF